MHVILTGATGLVGSAVLDAMLKTPDITKISILSRRPVAMADAAKDPRVNVIIHENYEKYDAELLSKLQGARGCVWALGISQTQVNAEDYVKITKTYAIEAAKAFKDLASADQPFTFEYVSGNGATTTPGRFAVIFARVKGETELALAELRRQYPNFHALSVRPGAVDPAGHAAIKPFLPATPMAYKLLQPLFGPIFRVGFKGFHSPTEPMGRVMTELAMGKHQDQFVASKDVQMEGAFPILENSVLRRLESL